MSVSSSGQAAVRAFLADPASYPDATTTVTPFETHGAVVFVTDTKAYKLKKAVSFPYMDYGTLALRQAMCEREISFNRRTAPEIYLRAVPVTEGTTGFAIGGEGPVVDWLVEMQRFDPQEVLGLKAERGELTPALLADLVMRVSRFHQSAETVNGAPGADALLGVIQGNDGQFAVFQQFLPRKDTARLTEKSLEEVENLRPLLDARAAKGKVRRCHGDMHLGNICLYQGAPLLFDCIEFNDAFALIDTLYDFAFLLMDLDHRGLQPLTELALRDYAQQMQETDGLQALPVMLATRAAIRAHVSCAIATGGVDAATRAHFLEEAAHYLQQGLGYLG